MKREPLWNVDVQRPRARFGDGDHGITAQADIASVLGCRRRSLTWKTTGNTAFRMRNRAGATHNIYERKAMIALVTTLLEVADDRT